MAVISEKKTKVEEKVDVPVPSTVIEKVEVEKETIKFIEFDNTTVTAVE